MKEEDYYHKILILEKPLIKEGKRFKGSKEYCAHIYSFDDNLDLEKRKREEKAYNSDLKYNKEFIVCKFPGNFILAKEICKLIDSDFKSLDGKSKEEVKKYLINIY